MSRHIRQITPFLHVPDLEAALSLLTGTLDFEVKYREPCYAYLEWGSAVLRVLAGDASGRMDGVGSDMSMFRLR